MRKMTIVVRDLNPQYRHDADLSIPGEADMRAEFHDKVADAVGKVLESSPFIWFAQDDFHIVVETK